LASDQGGCRCQQLCAEHAAGPEDRAAGETSCLLCDASSIQCGRLRELERAAWRNKSFECGTWGGEFRAEFVPAPGEIVAQEHWCSSGFANTDLDLLLKKHGIHQLIVIGLIAHTCIEATVRYAAELGYEVTVIKDATADYSNEMMHAALDINLPNYAASIVSTAEILASISALEPSAQASSTPAPEV